MGFLVPQVMEDGLPAVPQECVQNRTPEQLVDVPAPQIMEAIAENRFPEQLVDVPVPQIMDAIAEDRFLAQIVNSPVPQIVEAVAVNRFPEQIVISRVPQFFEASVENRVGGADHGFLCASVHWGRRGNRDFCTSGSVQNHTLEQVVDFPAPPNIECVRDVCVLYHTSGCRIVFWSRLWMCHCPTSSRARCLQGKCSL